MLITALVVQGPPIDEEPAEQEVDAAEEVRAERAAAHEEFGDELEYHGRYSSALEQYEDAYALVPDRHILSYKIGMVAWRLGRCTQAKEYLSYFLDHGELLLYAQELNRARELLQTIEIEGCGYDGAVPAPSVSEPDREAEVGEALRVGALPQPPDRSRALMIAGGTSLGVGLATLLTGAVLLGAGLGSSGGGSIGGGPNCTIGKPCGDTCISVNNTCHIGSTGSSTGGAVRTEKTGFVIGGGVLIFPISVALITTGSVLLARADQSRALTLTPTGIAVSF